MNEIDLNDYVAGGYFITKYATKGFWKSPLLPERVISVSGCFGKTLKGQWGWNLEPHREDALDFGVPADKLTLFNDWSLEADGTPDSGYSNIDQMRWAMQNILSATADVLLIGIGLHQELLNDFLTFKPYPPDHPNYVVFQSPSYEGYARQAIENHLVSQRKSLASGGNVLGWEVISFHFNLSHSWLCAGLEQTMNELYGIRPNQYGLINSYEEAKKVYEWIAEDGMQGTRTEPEPHYPWLIVQYPLHP